MINKERKGKKKNRDKKKPIYEKKRKSNHVIQQTLICFNEMEEKRKKIKKEMEEKDKENKEMKKTYFGSLFLSKKLPIS